MKNRRISVVNRAAIGIAVSLTLYAVALGQHASNTERINAAEKPESRMLYHNGPVRTGWVNDYFIWYGCWSENCDFAGDTQILFILTDFISNFGSTPYFQVNLPIQIALVRCPVVS